MKIAITSDVHGSKTWSKIDLNKFDRCILIGDYHDSYGDVERPDEISNFKEIIKWKKANMDKVILLLGNHDVNQYLLDEPCSRKAREPYFSEIRKLFEDNLDLFDIVYQISDKVTISHAGFTRTWMNLHNIKVAEDANKEFHKGNYKIFRFNGYDCYGGDVTQGPTWIRPEALVKDAAFTNQIVGHTQVRNAPAVIEENGNKVTILECPEHNCIYELEV